MLEMVALSSISGFQRFCNFCRVWLFSEVQGHLQVARGGVELRPRGLDDDFLIDAFSYQVWSCSVLLWRLQVVPGEVELRPGRSLERRESQELQMGGLRALEEAWTMTSRLTHSAKFGRFLCFKRCSAGRWRVEGAGGQV